MNVLEAFLITPVVPDVQLEDPRLTQLSLMVFQQTCLVMLPYGCRDSARRFLPI